MKPRLVLATDSLDPSGLGEHMLTLGRALAGRFDVVLAAPGADEVLPLLRRAARLGLGMKPIDLADMDGFSEWLRRTGAKLLHVHAGIGWEGHGLTRAGRAAGLPVVRTEHLPYLLTDQGQQAEYADEIRQVNRMIVVSEASRETYAPLPDLPPLTAIRNGVFRPEATQSPAVVREALGIGAEVPLLLTVARFTAQKAHATLLRAMPEVLDRYPAARLLLVGAGPEEETVAALIDELGIGGAVTMLGRRDDVPDLLGAADLFVLPSEFEGLPLVLLEAMAIGLPVVATAIGGTEEAVGPDYPLLAEARNSPALAAAIITALRQPEQTLANAEKLQQRFAANFTAEKMAEATKEVYAPLLKAAETSRGNTGSMDKTRIGFIGVGGIAHRHFGVLEQFDDVALTAFTDVDFGRAEQVAARFGGRAFDSHEKMLEAGDLDAVYVCIPPFAHGEAERALISHKLPFFVEKPLTLDVKLAEQLAAEVEQAGLTTAVGYHWRYLDIVDEARRVLADNPARLISGYWLDQTPPPQWWWHADQSGGQMVEQTTHIIDLARFLVGDVTTVFGLAGHTPREQFPGLDVPTVSTASLQFKSGAIGNIGSTCLLRWGHRVGLHLFGDGVAIELTDHDIMVDVGAGRPYRGAEGDPVWREDRDFVDAVRGGENRIRSPYGEALKSHRVALAISQSAQSGQPVLLS